MRKRRVSFVLLFCLVLSSRLMFPAAATEPETVVIKNVSLITMENNQVQTAMDVFVAGGRIATIAKTGTVKSPAGAMLIDGAGKYLMPGLIDMHVHIRKEADIGLYLASGITTIRNMHANFGTPLEWRKAIQDGTLLGPRFITAGPVLWDGDPGYKNYVDTPEKGRELVRYSAEQGFDLVKVYQVKTPKFLAIMDEARKQGIVVCGHFPDPGGDLDTILNSGIRTIEHLDELVVPGFGGKPDRTRIPEFVRKARAAGVTFGTVLSQWEAYNRALEEKDAFLTQERIASAVHYYGPKGEEDLRKMIDNIKKMDPEEMAKQKSDFPFLFDLLKALIGGGVNIIASTDSHQILAPGGESLINELELFVRAGLSRYDALKTTTVNAARALDSSDQFGTVSTGKVADLLLVDGNPLEDLAVLRKPAGVVLRGRWLDRDFLVQLMKKSLLPG